MSSLVSNLLRGMVVQTDKESWTGKYIYSDFYYEAVRDEVFWRSPTSDTSYYRQMEDSGHVIHYDMLGLAAICQNSTLNEMAKIPILGIAAGVIRSALSVIHILAHLFVAFAKRERGHVYHALKGGCEFIRGIIESLPIIGRIFSYIYCKKISYFFSSTMREFKTHSWWILKIYNPNKPDLLDRYANNWQYFRNTRPNAFIIA